MTRSPTLSLNKGMKNESGIMGDPDSMKIKTDGAPRMALRNEYINILNKHMNSNELKIIRGNNRVCGMRMNSTK